MAQNIQAVITRGTDALGEASACPNIKPLAKRANPMLKKRMKKPIVQCPLHNPIEDRRVQGPTFKILIIPRTEEMVEETKVVKNNIASQDILEGFQQSNPPG